MSEIATTLKDDLKKIPPWAYIAVGGGGLVLLVLRKRGGGVATTVSAAQTVAAPLGGTTLANPTAGLDPSLFQLAPGNLPGMASIGGPPGGSYAAAPAAPAPQLTFAQALGAALPSVYSPSGFAGNATDSAAGTSDLLNTLGQYGTADTGYQDWVAQLRAASASGNAARYHGLLTSGEQYGAQLGPATVAAPASLAAFGTVAPAVGGGGMAGPSADAWGRDQLYGYLGAL